MTSQPPANEAARAYDADFAPFFADYQPKAVRYVVSLEPAMPYHDVREIVSQAFLSTYTRWDEIANPGAYLFQTLRNGIRGHHRTSVRNALLLERLTPSRTSQVDSPDPLEGKIAYDDVIAALQQLPPKMRQVAVMKWMLDQPDSLIAEALGIRRSTVTTHLTEAARRLQKLFGTTATGRGTGKEER
ncbi:RNA polymerase sigma factor [Streptomyces hyaluromycini]|uniref:RNA polymerase sigma factor n=1 Tax=Streptomyces hyaluromycini TaxID=1377993 RepID=UPI00142E3884|nr:sigma-70 family RNA polymerase sigma factor [Streptomyces hyaluromycini]